MASGDRCTRPPAFPMRPDNRPALPRIGYRIGGYSEFRESLMRRLDATPELAHWTHREPDDPAIALLECAAVLGDILTFYQELYANEAFLRTASWQTSVAELVRLLGYRLAPGLGGRGTFALELRPGAPVTVPAGLSLQVELAGGDEPVVLETVGETVAYPELSRFSLHRPLSLPALRRGATELWIRSDPPVALAPDDRLLLARPSGATGDRLLHPQIVVVADVGSLHGATIIRLKGALQRDYPGAAVAFRLGRSFRHFGHSAPPEHVKVAGDRAQSTVVSYCRSLTGPTPFGSGPLAARDLPLATAVDDLVAGANVICSYVDGCALPRTPTSDWDRLHESLRAFVGEPLSSAPHTTVLRTVSGVRAASLRVGSLTGAATLLALERNLSVAGSTTADIRSIEIHEVVGPLLQVSAHPVDRTVHTGRELFFRGPAAVAAALTGRRLVLAKPGVEPLTTVATAVTPNAAGVPYLRGLHRITLAADVSYADFPQEPGDETATVVYGNLVDAEQGKSGPEAIVGSGDARTAFQTFKLPRSPLTYHHRPAQSPPQVPALEIWVAGRLWTRVDSLFGQAPDAEVYIVREDGEGASWVQFGDGRLFGARLPSGPGNVRARLRSGIGAQGPLKRNTRIQAGRLDGLDAVVLPGTITGGVQPEGADVARAAAPGRVQSLGRLVGLSDYESEALAIAGVALASASWGLVDGVPAVTVTVLMEGGREHEHAAVAASLRAAAHARGPDRFEIDVRRGRFHDVRLHAEVAVASGYDAAAVLPAVAAALGVARDGAGCPASGLFSLAERRFGAAEHLTRATGTIQNVAGVAWTRVAAFGALTASRRVAQRVACPADRVLRLADSANAFALTPVAGAATRNPGAGA